MRRILLLIEDFNELIYLQTILKKIGFDVEGVSQARKFEDVLLGFNPQSVIMTARGSNVKGVEIAPKLKKNKGLPFITLLKHPSQGFTQDQMHQMGVDLVLDTPVIIQKLVVGLSGLHGLEESVLLEKLNKMKANPTQESHSSGRSGEGASHDIRDELIEVKGGGTTEDSIYIHKGKGAKLVDEEQAQARKGRFAKATEASKAIPKTHFKREQILEFNKWIRSQPEPDDIDAIEEERKKFVRRLFRKD